MSYSNGSTSPYKLFWNWVFDGKRDSDIPQPEVLLKYNSPINETFLLKSFIKIGPLNHYLDNYLNNIGIRYISKEDLFFFVKQAVKDFKVKKRDIHYTAYKPRDILFEKISKKFPTLKPFDISLYCDIILKSKKDRDLVYSTFGIDKPKKKKIGKKKKSNVKSIPLEDFMKRFNITEL